MNESGGGMQRKALKMLKEWCIKGVLRVYLAHDVDIILLGELKTIFYTLSKLPRLRNSS